MKHLELHRLRKTIGVLTFGLFFPNENKKLNQKHGIGKQPDLVLVTPGTQTNTVSYIRGITGWTVKKSTAFVKEGDYPKVVIYNIGFPSQSTSYQQTLKEIENAASDGVIFEIY